MLNVYLDPGLHRDDADVRAKRMRMEPAPSFRRMPESILSVYLDLARRRDDDVSRAIRPADQTR